MTDACFEKAKKVIRGNASGLGIIAGRQYYRDIWGRDSLITSLGMSSSGDRRLVNLSGRTIESISRFRRNTGQLPNKISPDGKRVGFGEGGCVDTSLWYPVAVWNHYRNTNDSGFLKKHSERIGKVVSWLNGLDQNGDFLIETNEGSDWMDLLLRSGRVLYSEVLYYAALRAADMISKELGMGEWYSGLADKVKESINLFFWPEKKNLKRITGMYGYSGIENDFSTLLDEKGRDYYFAEVGFRRYDPRCDVLGNILSIIFGVADKGKTDLILRHLERERVHEPYPVKCLWPPIGESDPYRCFYFRWTDLPHLQKPGNYHNGGIWPYIGGFYVVALKGAKKNHARVLERLAEANRLGKNEYEFNEWLDCNGNPMGSAYQSWSAGTYILAYQYVKGSNIL
jgi:glycogen debranching enzyme